MLQSNMISIILPCYKSEKVISKMIDDICSQTYSNWELIIVSNGEGREVQESVIGPYLNGHENIRLLSLEIGGVSHARNVGIGAANGQYLTFVDADDEIEENHLERLVGALEDNTDIVVGGIMLERRKEKSIQELRINPNNSVSSKEMWLRIGGLKGYVFNKLYRTSFVKKSNVRFIEDLTIYEDIVFNTSLALLTTGIKYIAMTGYHYIYLDENSAMVKYSPTLKKACDMHSDLIFELKKQIGWSETDARKEKEGKIYYLTYMLVCNLYRKGSPFSFIEKKEQIKELVFNNKAFMKVFPSEKGKNDNFCRIFDVLVGFKSPTLMTSAFTVMFEAKKLFHPLYVFILPWLRKS